MMAVDADTAWLLADGRYAAEAGVATRGLPGTHLVGLGPGESYEEAVGALVRRQGWTTVGLEAGHLTLARAAAIRRAAGLEPALQWIETDGIVETLRMVKDPWEVAVLREAGARLSEVATCILPKVSAGRTEREVAWEIEVALHSAGFERPAFETIVASGPNAARPHHRPTSRALAAGELVARRLRRRARWLCRRHHPHGGGGADRPAAPALARRRRRGPARRHRRHRARRAALGDRRRRPRACSPLQGLGEALRPRHRSRPRARRARTPDHRRPRRRTTGRLSAGMVFTVEPGVYVPGRGRCANRGRRARDRHPASSASPARRRD